MSMEVFFIFTGLALLLTFAYGGMLGAPWVPSRKSDVERFLRLANLKPGDIFYELGAGDGRLVAAAARQGAEAHGFEVSLFPFFVAKFRGFISRDKGYHMHYGNFWHVSLASADVVYIFLSPKANRRLAKKFRAELKPGSRIIGYVWPLPGWTPEAIDEAPNRPKLYLYRR